MKTESTLTILDKQKERKDLMLEINRLKAEKEIVKRDLNDYTEAKTALQNEIFGGVLVSDLKETVLTNIRSKLKKDIGDLESKKDTLEKVTSKYNTLVQKSVEKYNEIVENTKKVSSDLKVVTIDLNRKREELNKESKVIDSEIEQKRATLQKLKEDNAIELKKIQDAQQEFENKKSDLMKQEIRLANKSQDLGIYEARLRKKYLELMPDMEIVV